MPTFPAAQASRTHPSAQTGRVAPAAMADRLWPLAQPGRSFPPQEGDEPPAYVGTKAASLDGVDEYLTCASPPPHPDTGFSVSFWVYQVSSVASAVFATQYTSASNFWRAAVNGGNLQFRWQTSTQINNAVAISTGAWTHFVAVFAGTSGARTLDLYKNGTPNTQTTGTGTTPTNNGAVFVGCSGTVGSFNNIRMCDVALWNTALSAGDAAALYGGGLRTDPRSVGSGPSALWAFTATDDMTGTTGSVADLQGGTAFTPINTESGDLVAGP